MFENKKWYVIHTRPKCEKKVSEILSKRKIENYCPLGKARPSPGDYRKTTGAPLFKSYVFAKVCEKQLPALKQIHGVNSFVCWIGKPVAIHSSEIESIRQFLGEHDEVRLEQIDININYAARATTGQAMENQAYIFDGKNNRARLILPSLGYLMISEVEKSQEDAVARTSFQWSNRVSRVSVALRTLISRGIPG